MQVVIEGDIARLLGDDNVEAMDEFKRSFARSVATAAGVSSDRVLITSVSAGSILVAFFIAPPTSTAGANNNVTSSAAAAERLQNTTAGGATLRDSLQAEGISCADPCSAVPLAMSNVATPQSDASVTAEPAAVVAFSGEIAVYGAVAVVVLLLLLCALYYGCTSVRNRKKAPGEDRVEQTDNPVHEPVRAEPRQQQRQQQQQLPLGWVERWDAATQRPYYANTSTRDTTWVRPEGSRNSSSRGSNVADNCWLQRTDAASGRSYYVNATTRQSSWSLPEGAQLQERQQQRQHQRIGGHAMAASRASIADPVSEEVEV